MEFTDLSIMGYLLYSGALLLIGIGYARPVPTDPRKYNTRWGTLLVAAAGPGMNLLLAFVVINKSAAAGSFVAELRWARASKARPAAAHPAQHKEPDQGQGQKGDDPAQK